MRSFTKYTSLFITIALVVFAVSCKKPAGPGGRASVKGKVYAYDYDNTVRYLISKGYSAGDKVYIIYGSNTSIGNKMETSMDGSFEFKYLNKGHYKVFVNSLDTTYKIKGNNTKIPVVREFDITKIDQTITLEDMVINK